MQRLVEKADEFAEGLEGVHEIPERHGNKPILRNCIEPVFDLFLDVRVAVIRHLQCFLDNSLVALSSPASVSGYMRFAKISRTMAIEWV